MLDCPTGLARTLIELAGIGAGSLLEGGMRSCRRRAVRGMIEPAEAGLTLADDRDRLKTAADLGP